MPLPVNADRVVVHGYWYNAATGGGFDGSLQFDPVPFTGKITPNVTAAADYAWIKTLRQVVDPDPSTAYYAVALLDNNDPDLTPFPGWRVTPEGEPPFTIDVSAATTTTVDARMVEALPGLTVGDTVRALWLTDAAIVEPAPTPPAAYLTAAQTNAAVAAHDSDPEAHPELRALIGDGGNGGVVEVPDATASTKGKAVILGGTADAPTVPWSSVTDRPSTLPPSGSAGGVLSGTFPSPGFAQDMATQAELDNGLAGKANTSHTHTAGQVSGLADVATTGAYDDLVDTPTIPAAYSDEQAQDAAAAALAAGTHTGIVFNYDDAGNAISATVTVVGGDGGLDENQVNALISSAVDGLADVATTGSYTDLDDKPVFDIRDHGATTGASNNAAAIQAAINAASAAGGGIVHIPAGVWMTGPLVARSFVSLRGVSEAGSTLRLVAAANAHMLTLADANTEQVGLVDLTLDGNKTGQSAGAWDVVYFDNLDYDNGRPFPSQGDPNHYAHRVLIVNGKRHGLHTYGYYSASQWLAVRAYRCDGNNFYIASPDNNFVSCVSAGSGLEGFMVVGNSERLLNCKVFTSGAVTATRGVGFRVANVARTDMIGCESQDNRSHGFSITGSYQVHLIGRADRNGLGPEPVTGYQGDGIYVENLRDSRIDLIAGDRAAGLDGNVGGGVTVMQRWAYNCGSGNAGNTVTIVSGLSASGNAGTGSWGTDSLVTITHDGEVVAGYGSGGGQPADDDLTAIAGLTPANNDVIQRKSGAWTNRTPAQLAADLAGTSSSTLAVGNDGRFTQVTTNAQTGTAYTLALADAGRVVEMTNAAANTVTVPPNSTVAFPVGTVIEVCQTGAGATTIAAGAGVTLRTSASLAARAQWSTIALRKRGSDEWVVSGDVS